MKSKRKNQLTKTVTCFLLVLCMVFSFMPISVGAADGEDIPSDGPELVVYDESNPFIVDENMTLTGELPSDASVTVDAVKVPEEEGKEVIAAYDISIYSDFGTSTKGNGTKKSRAKTTWQPGEDGIIVSIYDESLLGVTEEVTIWYVADDGTYEFVDMTTPQDGVVSFCAYHFSAYAIVQGPLPVDAGWIKLSASQIAEHGAEGLYIGHPLGFYAMNEPYTVSGGRTGILKTTPAHTSSPAADAAEYYFTPAGNGENQFIISCASSAGHHQYLKQSGNSMMFVESESDATVFTIDDFPGEENTVRIIGSDGFCWNMQGGKNGRGFAAYNNLTDTNARVQLWCFYGTQADHQLDGKTYGLMCWTGGMTGHTLQAAPAGEDALGSLSVFVMEEEGNRENRIFVPKNEDATMWTFEWVSNDFYYVTTEVDGVTYYLNVTEQGVYIQTEAAYLRALFGHDGNLGKICLQSGLTALTYSGVEATGFVPGTSVGSGAWLNLVETTEMLDDYVMIYSADKISVSDMENITNGSRLIVYTRIWNEAEKKYEFFIVDHDGSLRRCYEEGDVITWIGPLANTALWNLVEYYYDDGTPNYYYELYNQYSEKFICPSFDGTFLSDDVIGLTLSGRKNGDYYSSIIAWDDDYYAYAGLKAENGQIAVCPFSQASDFYFAVLNDVLIDDTLSVAPAIDHTRFGVHMYLVDFGNSPDRQNDLLDDVYESSHDLWQQTSGLLSTDLDENGWPMAANGSLSELFADADEVNGLFLTSIYDVSGYFEFDSTQLFASIQPDGMFKLYNQLGTTDKSNRPTLKHGQFFPFDNITAGRYASVNSRNLYSSQAVELSEDDPRKHEPLYLVSNPNYYFGLYLDASFVQTPNGKDRWGHDIIYEFTGDDDFWLYVDGELIIDLGGVHSALPGSVNYSTGAVSVNGTQTTLYALFKSNYETRNPEKTPEEVEAYLDDIFTTNANGERVFKNYTRHSMRIFFMERGAGASNLHMRFNLSAVEDNAIMLTKHVVGTESEDYNFTEYGYQIYYRLASWPDFELLTNEDTEGNPTVRYHTATKSVKYMESFTPAGSTESYSNVFFLSPDKDALIYFPEGTVEYRIVEVGVNSSIYDAVYIGDEVAIGVEHGSGRMDYSTDIMTMDMTPTIVFTNHVSSNAMRTLTITKRLYNVYGDLLTDDTMGFSFRLYLGHENASTLPAANLCDYHVKDPDGYYCRYDATLQAFVSTGKTDLSEFTTDELDWVTFQSSPNGSISKIPAYYRVEIPGLMVGTKFKVEERDYEIPFGYKLIGYEREGSSYFPGESENEGVIHESESPSVVINNQRGFGLTAIKHWSDEEFVIDHDDIYMAIYVFGELLPGSVRRISSAAGRIQYYWEDLPIPDTEFNDYVMQEVVLTDPVVDEETNIVTSYSSIAPMGHGSVVTVGAIDRTTGRPVEYTYGVNYVVGPLEGGHYNVRTDTITNMRGCVHLWKETWSGDPLSGAKFVLSTTDGYVVGRDTLTSNAEGLITTAYLETGCEYVLEETFVPTGYRIMQSPVHFIVDDEMRITVLSDPDGVCYVTSEGELVVRNHRFELVVMKVDEDGQPLQDCHFDLRREVTVNEFVTMDHMPIAGFEDVVSPADGVLPGINEQLRDGAYYIREFSAPEGYGELVDPVRFEILNSGTVLLTANGSASLTSEVVDDVLVYTITIVNSTIPVIVPTGIYMPVAGGIACCIIGLGGIACFGHFRKRKRDGGAERM